MRWLIIGLVLIAAITAIQQIVWAVSAAFGLGTKMINGKFTAAR
jgi:hypothetical protein